MPPNEGFVSLDFKILIYFRCKIYLIILEPDNIPYFLVKIMFPTAAIKIILSVILNNYIVFKNAKTTRDKRQKSFILSHLNKTKLSN